MVMCYMNDVFIKPQPRLTAAAVILQDYVFVFNAVKRAHSRHAKTCCIRPNSDTQVSFRKQVQRMLANIQQRSSHFLHFF